VATIAGSARTAQPIAVLDTEAATRTLLVAAGGARVAAVSFDEAGDAVNAGDAVDAIELWDIAHLHAPTTVAHLDDEAPWRIVANDVAVALGVRSHVRILDPGFHPIASAPGWLVAIRGDEVLVNADGRYTSYDARTGALRRVLENGSHLDAADASVSGAVLVSCDAGKVTVRDGRSDAVTAQFDTGTTDVTAIAVDELGRIATGHHDGAVRIWDAHGAPIAVARGHAADVNQLVIRGDRLLSGSWDESLRAWAWPSGESLGAILTTAGYDLAVSPSGRRIVTAEHTPFVDVWDGERGRLLERLPAHEPIHSLTFVTEDEVLGVGASGAIERVDLVERLRSDADIARLAATSRWQLVDGRLVERARQR
jgi:WD40 repeat protein